jgi:hypothetical protein
MARLEDGLSERPSVSKSTSAGSFYYSASTSSTKLKLVKKGIRWGVGDGTKIKILSDPCVPDVKPYMLRP